MHTYVRGCKHKSGTHIYIAGIMHLLLCEEAQQQYVLLR